MLRSNFQSKDIGRTIFFEDLKLYGQFFQSEQSYTKVSTELLIYIVHGILNRSLNLEECLLAVLEQKVTVDDFPLVGETIYVEYIIQDIKPTISRIDYIVINKWEKKFAFGSWTLKLKS